MHLALYKGPGSDLGKQVGHVAISAWTRSPYSHCELVFGDIEVDGMALCASSSSRDGGVRFKWIDIYSGHWDIVNLRKHGFTDADEEYAKTWFVEREGAGYDYLGLLFFLTSLRTERRQRWFCSEAVGAALKLSKPHKLSPGSLSKLFPE
jgi:hypothetical protein